MEPGDVESVVVRREVVDFGGRRREAQQQLHSPNSKAGEASESAPQLLRLQLLKRCS